MPGVDWRGQSKGVLYALKGVVEEVAFGDTCLNECSKFLALDLQRFDEPVVIELKVVAAESELVHEFLGVGLVLILRFEGGQDALNLRAKLFEDYLLDEDVVKLEDVRGLDGERGEVELVEFEVVVVWLGESDFWKVLHEDLHVDEDGEEVDEVEDGDIFGDELIQI